MQTSERSHLIIPNIFPAKLWHLVNQSDVTAIVWDSKGEGIKVHQELLERQILSPNTNTLACCNNFRGITFSSFIRQLYAYGFKKAEHCKRYQTEVHYYFHPHFNKNKPELLSLMCRSAPKYRRTVPFFPERETLPEKGNEKVVVHSRGDNPAEANMHRGSNLHHYPFKPVPLAHMVTRVQPPFPRRNGGGDPHHVSNMLQVPRANYRTVIVPTNSSLMHPLHFRRGVPNVCPNPECFVQVLGGYPQNHVAPRFFNASCCKTGYPANMCEVPAPNPVNVVPQHVQVPSPPASFPETEAVNTESISSSQSFHIPSMGRHSRTPIKSKHINNSPTPKPGKSPGDSSGRAAELLLFLSGQEPINNNQQEQSKQGNSDQ